MKIKSFSNRLLIFFSIVIVSVLLLLNFGNKKDSGITQAGIPKFIEDKNLGIPRSLLTQILKGLSNYPVYRQYFDNGILYWLGNNQKENIIIKYKKDIENVNNSIYKFKGSDFPFYSEKYLKHITRTEILYKEEWIDQNPQVLKGDPINIVFITKNKQDLINAFMIAGWTQPSLLRYFEDPFFNGNSFPISNLYLWGRKQDIGFSINTSISLKHRNHIRLWKSLIKEKNCEVWNGGATEDIGIEESRFGIRNDITTHKISPDVDKERDYIQKVFREKFSNIKINYINSRNKQLIETVNGNLDPFIWDGRLLVINICF